MSTTRITRHAHMERPERRANTIYLVDFIAVSLKPSITKAEILTDLYLKQGLSSSQIAEKLGCSKTMVLERLRAQGIRIGDKRKTNPNNYRLHQPPFGFSKRESKLIPNRKELRVCRMIVRYRDLKKWSYREIAKVLEEKKIKNRAGRIRWPGSTVRRIYLDWKEKI